MSAAKNQNRWKFLTSLPILTDSLHHHHRDNNDNGNDDEIDDPFACDDLIVPSSKEIIEDVIDNTISEWKELDDRKIIISSSSNNDGLEEDEQNHRVPKRMRRSGINLPKNFDYTTSSSSSCPTTTTTNTDDVDGDDEDNDESSEEEKVICLTNPNSNLNYSTELYKLFSCVPTEEEIQIQRNGSAQIRNTHNLKKEIEDAIKEYTRVDCHSLSRLRLRTLNHLPPMDNDNNGMNSIVRIECWNRLLKRGSSPDSHRFEAEFLCHSTNNNNDINSPPSSSCATLLDVHKAILNQYSSDTTVTNNNNDDDDNDSGLFFIENIFYVHGNNHERYYTNPIISWLNEELCYGNNTDKIKFPRKEYLGISYNTDDAPTIKPMSTAYLYNIDFRLAVRYAHFCYKTIESIFLFSDIRTTTNGLKQQQKKLQECNSSTTNTAKSITSTNRSSSIYPRIIDTFTRAYANTICQGCNHCVATVICDYKDEFTAGESTFLCTNCYYELHYDNNGNLRYNNYNVYSILDLELVHCASNSQSAVDNG